MAIGERGYATWRKATNETVAHCDNGEIWADHGNKGDGTMKRVYPKA